MSIAKDRELQADVKNIIAELNNMMEDVCTLEVSDNRAAITRVKRTLLEQQYAIVEFKKKIDGIRKEVVAERKEKNLLKKQNQ